MIAKEQKQPFTFQFTSLANQKNSPDHIFCHFYFLPCSHGNTVVWQFLNEQANSASTWQGLTAPSSVATTVMSALSTRLDTSTQAIATETPSSPSSPASHSDGLSTGAQAGIGVGIGVVVLAMLGGLILLWRRSRKRKMGSQTHTHDTDKHGWSWGPQAAQKSLPPGHNVSPWQQTTPVSELQGNDRIAELPSSGKPRQKPAELQGRTRVTELP